MIAQLPDTTREVDRESLLARAGRVIPNGVSAGGRDTTATSSCGPKGRTCGNADGRRYRRHRRDGGGRPESVRRGGLRREFGD